MGNWLRDDYEFGCCSLISANVVMEKLGLDNVRVPPGWVEEQPQPLRAATDSDEEDFDW